MSGIKLGIAPKNSAQWWPANASFAADFVNCRFMRAGQHIAPASAYSFLRASEKLADTQVGTWQSFADDVPAITNRGILLEQATTNMVINGTMTGAVPGIVWAGGALPTGWSAPDFDIVTIVETGTEDGLPYIELRLQHTNGTGGTTYPRIEFASGVPANIGEQWTAGASYKLISGAWHSNPSAFFHVVETGGSDTYATFDRPDDMTSRTPLHMTWTTTQSGSITLQMRLLVFAVNPAEIVDVTARFYAPTLANEPTASSPILSDGTSMTRAIDQLTLHLPVSIGDLHINYEDNSTLVVGSAPGGDYLVPIDTSKPRVKSIVTY